MTSILSIIDGMKTEVKLRLDNLTNTLLLQTVQFLIRSNLNSLLLIQSNALVRESFGSQQRAHVLRAEGWSLVVFGSHDGLLDS